MTPEEQETAANRRASRNVLAAVLFLIGILILLLFLQVDSAALRAARRVLFGKALSERAGGNAKTGEIAVEPAAAGASIGRLPENVPHLPSTNEVRAGAAGADQPADTIGAPGEKAVINEALEETGTTNTGSQALLIDDFSQRLQKAGARSGDVQISLEWKNKNDLDLHVIDPFGEEIFFGHRNSKSGGELDVDMNLVRMDNGIEFAADLQNLTDRPVENVYWPKRGAPRGMYRVEVVHFARHGGAADPTRFTVRVVNQGQARFYSGFVSYSPNSNASRVVVCTFMVLGRAGAASSAP
jgi:hypothetical protein